MTKKTAIPFEMFVKELLEDIPEMIKQFPDGIPTTYLQEYYGESPVRVMRACTRLRDHHAHQLVQTRNRLYLLFPPEMPVPLHVYLTRTQRNIIIYFRDAVALCQQRQFKTNFSQLSRVVKCSYTSLKVGIRELEDQGYVKVLEVSMRGRQTSMIIEVTDKLLTP